MLTVAFGESTVTRTQVQLWYNQFNKGREDVNNNARTGRPITSTTDENIEAVKKMILDNRRRIHIREVADDVGISLGSCQTIFTDVLGMKHKAAKIVPKLLNFEQKTTSHGRRSGNVDNVQRRSRFALKYHNW